MSWDIYGEPLRRGHCEVHPHVHEEYPCSVCIADKRLSEQQGMCKGDYENEHLLELAREHIKELEQERDALADRLERIKVEWSESVEEARELAAEHDTAIEQVCYWRERALSDEQQRDALAAHVERLEDIIERSTLADSPAAESALEDTPETSLARLKAQWQAEALGRVLAEVLTAVEADTVRAHLRNAMRKLRRQAEGGET